MTRSFSAGSAYVDIGPNFDDFVKKLRAQLERVDADLDVDVGADTTRAAADLRRFREEAGQALELGVDIDTAAATTELEAWRKTAGRDVEVGVKANIDRASLSQALAGASSGLKLDLAATAIGNAPALASGLASVGVELQRISGLGALLPGVFAGAGAGLATAATAAVGFKDALSDSPEKAMKAYQGMAASAREVADVAKGSIPELERAQRVIAGTTFEGVAQPFQRLIDSQLPGVERGMDSIARQYNSGLKIALAELGNDRSKGALSQIFDNSAAAAGRLNGAIVPGISSLRTLGETGSNYLPELAQGLTNLTVRFDNFIQRSQESGALDRWIRDGIDSAKELGSVVGNLGSILASVLRAARGDGDGLLKSLDNITGRMAEWSKSAEGQSKMAEFFRVGREQLAGWEPILQQLPSLLKGAYDGIQVWSSITMPFLTAAAKLLGEHPGLVQGVVTAYLAFKTIGPVFDILRTGIGATNGALTQFKAGAAEAGEQGAGRLGKAMGGVGALIGGAALGGPWGLAIGAATIGLGILATKHQEAAAAADRQRARLQALGQTLDEQSGKATQATVDATAKALDEGGYLERAQTLGVDTNQLTRAATGVDPAARDAINQRLTGIIASRIDRNDGYFDLARKRTGMSDEEIAQALQGVPQAVEKYGALAQKNGAPDLSELKKRLDDIGESAATLGGELNNVNSKLGEMGESNRRIQEAKAGAHELTEQGRADFEALGVAIDRVLVSDGKTVTIQTPTDEQKAKLAELGRITETLPDGSVKVVLDDAKAREDIRNITKPETKNVTVSVTNPAVAYQLLTTPGVTGPGEPAAIPKAGGGPITGGIPGVDSVPILAMPDEHMLDTQDVRAMGGHAGVYRFRAALKAGLVRGMASGGAVGWTEDDERKLQNAILDEQKAQQKIDKLGFDRKATDVDRRDAQQTLADARAKREKLEQSKTNGGRTPTVVLPQADLPGRKSEKQIQIENAQYAVDQANTKRNQIYNNPAATEEEKRQADNALLSAQNAEQKAGKTESTDELPKQYSVPGILGAAGTILGRGILSFFGLENSILSDTNVYNKGIQTGIEFFDRKNREAAGEDTGDYSYQPKNLPVEDKSTEAYTGGSTYSGGDSSGAAATQGTSGGQTYDAGGGVQQWSGTFAAVLRALSMPAGWLRLGLAQMQTESGGNPRAINLTDSNAKKGTPSKGLMQVIDPTFQSYRSSIYPNDIWDPGANIAASLRYTVARYGGPEGVWGQGHGYDQGGIANGIGLLLKQTIKPERVLSPRETETFESSLPLLQSINTALAAPGVLPQGFVPGGSESGGNRITRDHSVQFHGPVQVMDMDHLVREQDRWAAIQSQGVLAAY
ncbi:transglycosylase SLT domain-containing protein [Nocardia wallacei]|uniref:transglycosylase SLT domain-containing protein n=1 Tax=Nocardia wallacei TaxID=480035 RepID=UPI0024556779|nr:transglycosylase SLT domain-containing protein [Nocardia wallacei]